MKGLIPLIFTILTNQPNVPTAEQSTQSNYKINLKAENGKGYFKVEGPATWLVTEIEEKYFFVTKKINCSVFANSVERVYKQNKIEWLIPEGIEDVLTVMRKKAESPYQAAKTETLAAFVDGEVKEVIIKDYSPHNSERIIEMRAKNDGLGGGIKAIKARIYLLNDKKNDRGTIPLINLEISHEKKKDPICFFTKEIEKQNEK